jgi:hypothetical protein
MGGLSGPGRNEAKSLFDYRSFGCDRDHPHAKSPGLMSAGLLHLAGPGGPIPQPIYASLVVFAATIGPFEGQCTDDTRPSPSLGEATAARGGRAKRYFTVNGTGQAALRRTERAITALNADFGLEGA